MTKYPTVVSNGGYVFPDPEYVLERADPNFLWACSTYRYSN